jgi:hypothetical protein
MNKSVLPTCPDETPILKCRCVNTSKKTGYKPNIQRKTRKHSILKSRNPLDMSTTGNKSFVKAPPRNILVPKSKSYTVKINKRRRCPNGMYINKKTGLCKNRRLKAHNSRLSYAKPSQQNTSHLPDLSTIFESDKNISPLTNPSAITPLSPVSSSFSSISNPQSFSPPPLDKNITVRKKASKKLTVLKSTTPMADQLLSNSISINMRDELSNNSNIALPDSSEILPPDMDDKIIESSQDLDFSPISDTSWDQSRLSGFKSYSPEIHKRLQSLKSIDRENIQSDKCTGTTVKIGVHKNGKDKCRNFKNKNAQAILLHNLSASKHVNPKLVISPKQFKSNCWFNAMFMTFFVSDKGRKFFKYFRQLMIQGRTIDNHRIPQKLWQSFFLLNQAIEASLAGNKVTDTNSIIRSIFNNISSAKRYKYDYISAVNEAGNPHRYYLDIINYLGGNLANQINIYMVSIFPATDIDKKDLFDYSYTNNILNSIYNRLNNIPDDQTDFSDLLVQEQKHVLQTEIAKIDGYEQYIPDILIIESTKNIQLPKKYKHLSILEFTIGEKTYSYKLDSATVKDIGGDHFCALLTLEGKEYAFDGGSYKRLIPFKWKKHVNSDWNWQFKELSEFADESPITMTWNFSKEYSALYYYRVK